MLFILSIQSYVKFWWCRHKSGLRPKSTLRTAGFCWVLAYRSSMVIHYIKAMTDTGYLTWVYSVHCTQWSDPLTFVSDLDDKTFEPPLQRKGIGFYRIYKNKNPYLICQLYSASIWFWISYRRELSGADQGVVAGYIEGCGWSSSISSISGKCLTPFDWWLPVAP